MNRRKIVISIILITLVIIGVIIFLVSRKQSTVVPPPSGQLTPLPSGIDDSQWRVYEASAGKYAVKLPSSWFIDPDLAQGGGDQLYISNNDGFEVENPDAVILEFDANVAKKSGESLLAAVKRNGKAGGDFGATEIGFNVNGYEMARVEHAYGNSAEGPGYAVARSNTSYMYIVASSDKEDEIVRAMIHTLLLLK